VRLIITYPGDPSAGEGDGLHHRGHGWLRTFVVLDRDLFKVTAEEIVGAEVLLCSRAKSSIALRLSKRARAFASRTFAGGGGR